MTATATATANNDTKLMELVLYVATRCEKLNFFGAVKLNKILFYSDMNSYLRRGRGVTGVRYLKKVYGPVPDGIDQLVERMEETKEAVVLHRAMPDLTVQDRVVARRSPKLDIFDGESIAIVDEVIEWISPMTANEVSDLTHKHVGWTVANFGEEIPYSASLIPDCPIPLSPEEIDYGVSLGQKIAERVSSAG